MSEGIIIKALSGFYYVADAGNIICCKAKGNFRHKGLSPLVGDKVVYTVLSDGKGTVDQILPRENSFIRPAVANIDTMVFIASGAKPVTDPYLIDRIAVIAANNKCEFIVCLNKNDLVEADELYKTYSTCGYTCLKTSAETGEGMEELKKALDGKISVFTGNSGVGKSCILNRLIPGINVETAEISDKLGRGKHTTRHVEIFRLNDHSFIADTPGFASFELMMVDNISIDDLPYCFPEFVEHIGSCRFNDCRHVNEPDCSIREAVKDGKICQTRYDSYLKLYDIIANHKPWD